MAGWNTVVQAETLSVALGRPDLAIDHLHAERCIIHCRRHAGAFSIEFYDPVIIGRWPAFKRQNAAAGN